MQLIINADDYGLSQGVTDNILKGFDQGALTGTSIMATGQAFDYAIAEYKKRSNFRLAVHLNLVEGVPLSPLKDIPLLVQSNGEFGLSFQQMWWKYWRSDLKQKEQWKQQIRQELSAQLKRVVDCFEKDFELNVDSHLHYHMLPFVFECLVDLHDEFPLAHVRLPNEFMFFMEEDRQTWKNYLSLAPIKNLLLSELSRPAREQLQEKNIAFNDHFIGILFSGKMTESVIQYAFEQLPNGTDAKCCEILFHPGKAKWDEIGLRPAHYSENRQKELETVQSETFQNWVNQIQKA